MARQVLDSIYRRRVPELYQQTLRLPNQLGADIAKAGSPSRIDDKSLSEPGRTFD